MGMSAEASIEKASSLGEATEKRDEVASSEYQEYTDLLAKFDDTRVKSLLRRVDIRLMPPLAILYLIAFVDRSNIGNARLQGLERDLQLSTQQFAWCLTIFFFPYALFEVPSNVMLKLLKPSVWLTLIVTSWGVVMTVMGLCQNYSALLACRFFLGVFEAGLFPGCAFITTAWYKRFEVQYRVALFYTAASLSGAFSGLLAFAIGKMDGVRGYSGWRWLFILEGLATVVISTICYFLIPDSPGSAKWLSPDEARFLELRLQFDGNDKGSKEGGFQWKYVIQGFTDSKVYLGTIMFGAICTCTYSLSYSLPTMINLLGYSAANAQLLTIPVYAFGCIICVANSVLSDRYRHRAAFIIGPMFMTMVGLIIGMAVDPNKLPGVIYFALFLVAGGIFSGIPTTVAWISNNLAVHDCLCGAVFVYYLLLLEWMGVVVYGSQVECAKGRAS
ncbi:predicted protein [Uncinocarpus reesii 1704]|uniref:Major facilitator superfamily (MFS) profile domain-containing protein n=1 Tax=Uncinocarpus reesii (strain UAMH 1704) TaxID=336963 RepID=C4JJP3_UNCRE|nr:uncharacterized protein UREG_01850 [Uncinocarpus reesii 1704]EEP77001.1 predicted protein [Uncinocarpus reesii 1704]